MDLVRIFGSTWVCQSDIQVKEGSCKCEWLKFPAEVTEFIHVVLQALEGMVQMQYVIGRIGPQADYIIDVSAIEEDVDGVFWEDYHSFMEAKIYVC